MRMERGARWVLSLNAFNCSLHLTRCAFQSIGGGTFKDEKAGLQQKFTERGVVSNIAFRVKPKFMHDERQCRLQCAIQARIPMEANFSSRLALRRSSMVRPVIRLSHQCRRSFKTDRCCAGKHVVFGKVVSGFEVLEQIEAVGVPSGQDGEPIQTVLIFDCGLLP